MMRTGVFSSDHKTALKDTVHIRSFFGLVALIYQNVRDSLVFEVAI